MKSVFLYEKDRNTHRPIESVVRHPRKKNQEELWDELLEIDVEKTIFLSYDGA